MKPPESQGWPPEYRRNRQRKNRYRFAALLWGSRGDIQPFAALGAELVSRGHQVIVAARKPFRPLIEAQGMEFYGMEEDGTEDLMRALAEVKKGIARTLGISIAYSRGLIQRQFRSFWEASQGADVILTKGITTTPAIHVAERRGIPIFLAHFDPGFIPTRQYCLMGDRIQDRGRLANRTMVRLMLLAMGMSVADLVHLWRKENHLPRVWPAARERASHLFRLPAFVAWSPHLLSRPSDWPEGYLQTGWWRPAAKAAVSARLQDFVAAGAPPVYIGFGSWGVHDKTAVTDLVLGAVQETGNRAILLRHTVDGRAVFPENVLVEEDLPFEWLFPRLKAVVHHGGAGTTGAVARAGVPALVIPGFLAQAAWGHIVIEKGIGTMLNRHELSQERLAAGLHAIARPEVRARASEIGTLVRSDGAEKQAADEIERRLSE